VLLAALSVLFVSAWFGGLVTTEIHRTDSLTALALSACGLTGLEVAFRLGWIAPRRKTATLGLLAAWSLPVAVLLPPVYVLAVAVILHGYHHVRSGRVQPGRLVFAVTSAGLAGFLASLASHALGDGMQALGLAASVSELVALAAAAVVLGAVSASLSVAVLRISGTERALRRVLGGADHLGVELAELTIGMLVSVVWLAMPPAIVMALVPEVFLQRSRWHSELERKARTDAKTGLANHAHWRDVADRELTRTRMGHESLAVLIVDIDHFKAINDEHGHLVGDEVICSIADNLSSGLRPRDLVGRFGGEEFVVLLAESDLEQAHAAAERFRERISELVIRNGEHNVRATVSVGIAAYPINGGSLHELLDAADRALYVAKHAGRNCVRDAMPSVQEVLDLTGGHERLGVRAPA
jgi:diguanylate cyclase (GGDEF)-like protein